MRFDDSEKKSAEKKNENILPDEKRQLPIGNTPRFEESSLYHWILIIWKRRTYITRAD
jgi:ribosomal protein S10